ncbi:hypothetical protein CPB86DRAFT_800316 [Serendipita vermifera]|nr:hypothetical protein CPB86DRAFT_800316 [Serendipita vermifera]
MLVASFLTAVSLVAPVLGHSIFQELYVNGVSQGHNTGIRVPSYNDVTSNDIICNGGINPLVTPLPTTIINIAAGASVTAEWHHGGNGADPNDGDDPIANSHKGPVIAYLAKVGSALQTDVTGLGWFKIYHDGLHSDGTWAVDTLIANDGKVTFSIPSCVPPGNYFLRVEIIALHGASVYPGAQFYMGCAQINITGGGSASPSTVSFPGGYSGSDPGVLINGLNFTDACTFTILYNSIYPHHIPSLAQLSSAVQVQELRPPAPRQGPPAPQLLRLHQAALRQLPLLEHRRRPPAHQVEQLYTANAADKTGLARRLVLRERVHTRMLGIVSVSRRRGAKYVWILDPKRLVTFGTKNKEYIFGICLIQPETPP